MWFRHSLKLFWWRYLLLLLWLAANIASVLGIVKGFCSHPSAEGVFWLVVLSIFYIALVLLAGLGGVVGAFTFDEVNVSKKGGYCEFED